MAEDLYMSVFFCISVLLTGKYSLYSFPPQSRFRVFSDVKCVNSKINLIDLAGSERLSKTGVSNGRNISVGGEQSGNQHGGGEMTSFPHNRIQAVINGRDCDEL